MAIKWDYDAPEGSKTIEQAKVEALREIAEQLNEINDHLSRWYIGRKVPVV